ncbi:MAG: thioredoxin family protein [Bacteroidales bacterium]|nr:thioredoxin family protein [Bacteroidales bacterium]
MKNAFLLIILLFISTFSSIQAQILEPVKWSFKVDRISDKEAELQFVATIDKNWHVYSQIVPPLGPRPTIFTIDKGTEFKLKGKVVEPTPIEEYDPNFEMKVKYFAMKAIFRQKIVISSPNAFTIKGVLEFMCCDDHQCIPPTEVPFSFKLDAAKDPSAFAAVPVTNVLPQNKDTNAKVQPDTIVKADVTPTKTAEVSSGFEGKNNSLLWFFLQAFGWGLLAILTPCVFPMIPMTVSYFMKSGSKGKVQAIIYGLSIVAIYVVFGVLISVLFGADFGNWLSTHWIPNVLFFIIFVVFAASFFGYFEITVPNWLVNKSVQNEDKGGLMGTIFMALTLVLVSFSCTGPIVGTVVVQAVGGEVIKPVIGMLGFSLAFAIPFTLFAFFPQWLNKMPKSGGWLNSVKVVLGFIELAFALKFLNVPDQTYHWGILDREIYLGFWIVIFTMMGFYLLGKIKFPHDSDYPVVKSFPRLVLIIVTFTFVIYLIPGLWGAPLKGISGWLPPSETQDFDINAIVRESGGGNGSAMQGNIAETPKYGNTALKLPHGLKGYFDYDQALKASKELNKPVFVDFTGHGCTNCREMENRVWSDPEILKRLRENFVLVALYVDDKVIEMPKEEWYTTKEGRTVKLLGKKNTDIQINKYGANAQPYYLILDAEGNKLAPPRAYDLSIEAFTNFLDDGYAEYQKTHLK